MKAFSTFTGIGGFELGFQRAGIPVHWVGHSEIDRFAESVYHFHFSNPNYGDISTIDPKRLPDFDLLVGGFPCQAFSTLGARKGFADHRGNLFFELVRLLKAKSPRFFLFENVKGLLSHDGGKTFRCIINTLADLGYSVQWQVCDSAGFGVGQVRERVFLIGHFGALPRGPIFPLPGTSAGTARRASRPVTVVMTPRKRQLRPGCRRFKNPGEPMFTLTTGDRHGIFDGKNIRLLTPLECERLQGFPDNWTKYGMTSEGRVKVVSDSQRYKCLGNAVTVNVVAAIAMQWFGHTDGIRMKDKRKNVKRISS